MKGKILGGCLIAVVLLILVPATNAIQVQIIEQNSSSLFYSYDAIRNMDSGDLIAYIRTLTKNYPELSEEFEQKVTELGTTFPLLEASGHLQLTSHQSSKGPRSLADNQTLLEKIYWKIFNYRVFRLYLSTMLFLYTHSKLSLMRTTTWAIRLLRWVRLGIILGYINPTQPQPQPPTIVFQQDVVNRTLTVTSVSADNIPWSDIDQIGSGHCDPFPSGNVTVGNVIIDCSGIIVLRYIPLNEVLGVFDFG
jgi:hypothetical protein